MNQPLLRVEDAAYADGTRIGIEHPDQGDTRLSVHCLTIEPFPLGGGRVGDLFLPCRQRKGYHAAGFMAGLRSSFKKDRTKIPTMYVMLSNVSAVAKPVLSMR